MKTLLWALVLAALAAATALLLRANLGTVVALAPPWRIDFSLNFLLLLLAVALWLAFLAGRLAQRLRDFPERVRAYRERRSELGAVRGLREALRALFEGRFARAERAARRAQSVPTLAGIAALVAARAAHRMQEFRRREQWLERAEQDPELNTARLVLSAEMWSEQRDNARALQAIEQLHGSGARHIHALRIALVAHLQSHHWQEAIRIVRTLDKHRGLVEPASLAYKAMAYRGLVREAADDAMALDRAWEAVPAADRVLPEVAIEAARAFARQGRGEDAARTLALSLRDRWDERTLEAYARCPPANIAPAIAEVEGWLQEHGRSAAALRCLGRLCAGGRLWGKARAFLEESWRLEHAAATAVALAEVAQAGDDPQEAARWYQEAAQRYAEREVAEPPPAQARWYRREPSL